MAWTHRERMLAALNHEEPDRVPIGPAPLIFCSPISDGVAV
ncbi:uncharacterized protein METZ01_LOCUS418925 [marine metagenome]|uniref:Uncharacterized protein n=1 Tax=marine metagenome TaxID=408172 RepID=A0A382X723_9ZZZZ